MAILAWKNLLCSLRQSVQQESGSKENDALNLLCKIYEMYKDDPEIRQGLLFVLESVDDVAMRRHIFNKVAGLRLFILHCSCKELERLCLLCDLDIVENSFELLLGCALRFRSRWECISSKTRQFIPEKASVVDGLIKFLVNKGADINVCNEEGVPVLKKAAELRCGLSGLHALVSNGAIRPNLNVTASPDGQVACHQHSQQDSLGLLDSPVDGELPAVVFDPMRSAALRMDYQEAQRLIAESRVDALDFVCTLELLWAINPADSVAGGSKRNGHRMPFVTAPVPCANEHLFKALYWREKAHVRHLCWVTSSPLLADAQVLNSFNDLYAYGRIGANKAKTNASYGNDRVHNDDDRPGGGREINDGEDNLRHNRPVEAPQGPLRDAAVINQEQPQPLQHQNGQQYDFTQSEQQQQQMDNMVLSAFLVLEKVFGSIDAIDIEVGLSIMQTAAKYCASTALFARIVRELCIKPNFPLMFCGIPVMYPRAKDLSFRDFALTCVAICQVEVPRAWRWDLVNHLRFMINGLEPPPKEARSNYNNNNNNNNNDYGLNGNRSNGAVHEVSDNDTDSDDSDDSGGARRGGNGGGPEVRNGVASMPGAPEAQVATLRTRAERSAALYAIAATMDQAGRWGLDQLAGERWLLALLRNGADVGGRGWSACSGPDRVSAAALVLESSAFSHNVHKAFRDIIGCCGLVGRSARKASTVAVRLPDEPGGTEDHVDPLRCIAARVLRQYPSELTEPMDYVVVRGGLILREFVQLHPPAFGCVSGIDVRSGFGRGGKSVDANSKRLRLARVPDA